MSELGIVATASGALVNPFTMTAVDVRAIDIIRALANVCRWGGACTPFYSVAEHSVWVAREASKSAASWAPDSAKRPLFAYALLHDASEAYLGDVRWPIKVLPEFAFYRAAESRLQREIHVAFGLDADAPEWVHREIDRFDKLEAVRERAEYVTRANPLVTASTLDPVSAFLVYREAMTQAFPHMEMTC